MYFVGLGLLLLLFKVFEYGPIAQWPWWRVLLPFGGALVWWAWADASGYTKRREVDKMNERVVKRREESLAALGMDARGRRRAKRPR